MVVFWVQKVCLGKRGLGEHWDLPEAKDLRESIKLQSMCLKNSKIVNYTNKENMKVCEQNSNMPTTAHEAICCKWVQCLHKAGAAHLSPAFVSSLLLSLLDENN